MTKAMKKAIILFVLFIVIPLCLFAESWFKLTHVIEAEKGSVTPEFWVVGGTTKITGEVPITESPLKITTLGLQYEGVSIINLAVGYSPLFFVVSGTTLDRSQVYPYEIEILNPSEETLFPCVSNEYVQTVEENGVSVSYRFVDLISQMRIGERNTSGSIPVADLRIILDDEAAGIGTYRGTIMLIITDGS